MERHFAVEIKEKEIQINVEMTDRSTWKSPMSRSGLVQVDKDTNHNFITQNYSVKIIQINKHFTHLIC